MPKIQQHNWDLWTKGVPCVSIYPGNRNKLNPGVGVEFGGGGGQGKLRVVYCTYIDTTATLFP